MYAIIRTGGKQYKVQAGDTLRVEKLEGELGSEIDLSEVLVVGGEKTFVGEPTVQGAVVTVVVTRQAKASKVIVFKKKRRQGYRRMRGHRQLYTELFVKSITSPEGQISAAEREAQVVDPAKKAAKLAKSQEVRKVKKEAAPKGKQARGEKKAKRSSVTVKAKKKVTAKKATKKKVAKKAATKKKVTKKASANKKKATKKKA